YEYFPLDFISENLMPWKIRDVRRFHYHLEPARTPNTAELLKQAQELRMKGQSIGAPAAPVPMTVAPAPAPVTPAPGPPSVVPAPAFQPVPVGPAAAPVGPLPANPLTPGR